MAAGLYLETAPGTKERAARYRRVPKSTPAFALPLDTPPMEARLAAELPRENGPWQYEPKWDGFRCLAFKRDDNVELRSKSGKPLGRYFPEIVDMLHKVRARQFVLDGELVIELDGAFSFDALQMRLHPAESRIRKLSVQTPARLILFDMLADIRGKVLLQQPLHQRRLVLETFMKKVAIAGKLELSSVARTHAKAAKWLRDSGVATDGVAAKRLDDPYLPGERAMVKVKRIRTADCVVGGFRYESGSKLVGSLLLGLYNADGNLDHVGFTSTITDAERPALTRKLEKLRGGAGFSGKAPGGPSRWSTERSTQWEPLKPRLVVEVKFDQVTGDRFRHGTKLLRWRPDKAPRQCTFEQIAPPKRSR